VTPEFLLDATAAFLSGYGKPIRPIGQGAASDAGWQRFAARARMLGMPGLSVWRIGTAHPHVWPVLQQSAPAPAPAAPEAVNETSSAPVEQRVEQTSSVQQEEGKPPAQPAEDAQKKESSNEESEDAKPKLRPILERLRFGLGNR
jgi:hypothetical protein